MNELHAQATMLVELRRWTAAEELLGRLLATHPEDPYALCLLSQVRLNLSEPESALSLARRAIAFEPDDDWAFRLASVALSRLGQHDAAVRAASRAVEMSPDGWPSLTRLARAAAHPRAGRKELAIAERAAGRAVAVGPEIAETHLAQGAVALARGRRRRARDAYARAAALAPASPEVGNELARLSLSRRPLGRPAPLAQAAAGFASVAAADPTSPTGRHNLELTLRLFLGRVSYAIFVVVFIAARGPDATPPQRIPPGVLILFLVPVAIAVTFVVRIGPALRRRLGDVVRHGDVRAALGCELLAVAALAVACTRPPLSAGDWADVALLLVVAGRLLLAGRRATTTTPILVALAGGLAATGALLLVAADTPGGRPAGVAGCVFLLAALVPLRTVLRRRRTARQYASGFGPARPRVAGRR